jgi:hypothetical protein
LADGFADVVGAVQAGWSFCDELVECCDRVIVESDGHPLVEGHQFFNSLPLGERRSMGDDVGRADFRI